MAFKSLGGPVAEAFQSWQHGMMGGNLTVVDKVPEDMRYLVDSHWYQFAPLNPLWHSVLGFSIFMLGMIAMVGNGMVIYIFTSTKSLRSPSNLLVVNLAFSDFLMMFCMCPPMVYNCLQETWSLGPLFCTIYGMFGSLFGCVSIWTMTLIAFDRYNIIVNGLSAKHMTHGGARIRILLVWLASLLWTAFPLFGWNRYVPEGNMTACGTDYLSKDFKSRSYILVYSVFVYWAPLFLIIFSYTFIMKAVAAHERAMREQAKKMNVSSLRSSETDQQSTECKLAKVALCTISLWFMAWTPYLIINFAGIFESTSISPLATIWGSVFAKANAVYNPIVMIFEIKLINSNKNKPLNFQVYGISHPKYRQALMNRFPALACTNDEEENLSLGSENTEIMTEKPEKA
uniref:CSON008077 protein n=1 Tax=Culicoides sonorensis TaxID=179676 RepID=A0A336M3P1_CULSO